MVARVSLGGSKVRVRLSSAINTNTVKIGAAHIARRSKDSGIVAGSDRVLTFGGKPSATLYAGGVSISDPVDLELLLEGINDISRGSRESPGRPLLTADDLIAGYQQMIEMARMHGVQVIGCTITPYGGRSEYAESVRVAVNKWIRTSGAYYAVVDFDATTRLPDDPKRFRPEVDSPDGTHPANPGYKMMADAVDLSIFSKK